MPQGEFALIDNIVSVLGAASTAPWISVGPGDDAAVIALPPDHELVSSIDTLLADVHFPAEAPAELIGYRAMMVALSDLAAMAATPSYALVALTLPQLDNAWVSELTQGMAAAAEKCQIALCGGNVSRGPLSITVSVHGQVPVGLAVLRATAQPGDGLWVSGALGAAAACVRQGLFQVTGAPTGVQIAYYKPSARFDCVDVLRSYAHAAIDISDGLLADAQHIAKASNLHLDLDSTALPAAPGATLEDMLNGGDDYQLLVTAAADAPLADVGFVRVGEVQPGPAQLTLDSQPCQPSGYDHFDD